MNEVAERKPGLNYANIQMSQTGGGGALVPQSFGEVVAFAEVMSRADVAVPKHLRGNAGACLAVAMQALRWEMDMFAVANKSYSVNDRLAYEAQLIAAVVHTRAPIARRPDYAYEGEGPTRKCIISVEMLDGTTKTYESPEFGKILTKNSPLWKADLDQQLGYFSIRSWARRHTPEVILGVYAPEELQEARLRNITPTGSGVAARLRGGGSEGFTAAQAEREGVQVEEGVAIDLATGEIIDAEVEEISPEDLFPGDKAAPTVGTDHISTVFDVEVWAMAFEANIPNYTDLDLMRGDWADHKADLQKANPDLFKDLNAKLAAQAEKLKD